jgi:hypothetical protein
MVRQAHHERDKKYVLSPFVLSLSKDTNGKLFECSLLFLDNITKVLCTRFERTFHSAAINRE